MAAHAPVPREGAAPPSDGGLGPIGGGEFDTSPHLYAVKLPGVPIPVPRIAYPGDPESLLGDDLGRYPIDRDPSLAEVLELQRWADLALEYVRSSVPDLWPF